MITNTYLAGLYHKRKPLANGAMKSNGDTGRGPDGFSCHDGVYRFISPQTSSLFGYFLFFSSFSCSFLRDCHQSSRFLISFSKPNCDGV